MALVFSKLDAQSNSYISHVSSLYKQVCQDEPGFNNLNHKYGQSYIEEIRSWEGKEHKLAKYKCHLHFNLRCLSQNIVPKGVKLNIKQFQSFKEKQIICKTHRSILNSHG